MFEIGHIFRNGYPPEVASWCNENNAYIEEIEPNVFQIKAVPEPTEEELASSIRAKRDAELSRTDWTDLPHNRLTEEQKAEAIAYRDELRDLPQSKGFPSSVVFPETPDFLME